MAYTSLEEQELNEIKSWWNENYKSLIAAAVIGISGVLGWRFWQDHQLSQAQLASAQYEQLIYAQTTDAAQIDAFVKKQGKTAYSALVLLQKAQKAVEQNDFTQAEQALKEAMAQSPDEIFSSIAAIRLAEVQIQQQRFDDALASLNLAKDSSWENKKMLLTGEIQQAKGENDAAKASFEAVLEKGSALERQEAQVRLNNL